MEIMIWMFPAIFLLHELEEIFLIRKWKDSTKGNCDKKRRFIPYKHFVSTEAFILAVLEEFIIILLVMVFVQESGFYLIWLGAFGAFTIHLISHCSISIRFMNYVPGIVTAVITIPLSIYMFYNVMIDTSYTLNQVLIMLIICIVILIINLLLLNKYMLKLHALSEAAKTNPIKGLLKTTLLLLCFRVNFHKDSIGIEMHSEVRKTFTVFRHVTIKPVIISSRNEITPVKFIIRFTLKNMCVEKNIVFSKLPMMIFMGFTGFRSKYWTVNYKTGEYQGIYMWDSYEDAIRYSKSIAVKFMTRRALPDSVKFNIEKASAKSLI